MNQAMKGLNGLDAILKGDDEFSNLSNSAHCCITARVAKACINITSRAIIGLGVALSGVVYAQQAAIGTPIHSDGNSTELSFGGLAWRIPTLYFMGIRPHTNDSKELLIQFGWKKKNGSFISVYTPGYDVALSVHVRKVDDEDPRNGLALIRRIHLPFTKVPILASAKFNGMTYIGSTSGDHYFTLNNENVYVICSLIEAARLVHPQVDPDVLSKKFACQTMFLLPHNIYAWVTNWRVDLNDTAPAFVAAHRQIISYIR